MTCLKREAEATSLHPLYPRDGATDVLREGRSLGEFSVSQLPGCKTEFWENFGVNYTQPGDLSQGLSSWLPPL